MDGYMVIQKRTIGLWIREAWQGRPGQKMQVLKYAGLIELIPERDTKELRGFLKGSSTEFKREEDRV